MFVESWYELPEMYDFGGYFAMDEVKFVWSYSSIESFYTWDLQQFTLKINKTRYYI